MSHDSYRNKHLLKFSDGRLMLLAEVSCSNVTDWRGRRCWDWVLFHPKDSLFYTKETLKARQTEYVNNQLDSLRDYSKRQVERGWAKEYEEPTVESYDYNGTVFPGGSRIKNGRAFFGGRPEKAEEFFAQWENPDEITFKTYDKNGSTDASAKYSITRNDLDFLYAEFMEENGPCYVGIR